RNTSVALLIRGERNAVIVFFGLDYTVNGGRSEGKELGRELCPETTLDIRLDTISSHSVREV
ncbi:hypothetical protein, partial [Microcoleus sp. herbarium5]|uniref:hypothetical protein n=1 Tax=Microcoleus sp. herbarium5 TaxID=3055434 RepID=UPI002FCFAF83